MNVVTATRAVAAAAVCGFVGHDTTLLVVAAVKERKVSKLTKKLRLDPNNGELLSETMTSVNEVKKLIERTLTFRACKAFGMKPSIEFDLAS
jgi:hypothetical protein